jgi:DNA-directed RNA polymerase subunit RPC12/RpoP
MKKYLTTMLIFILLFIISTSFAFAQSTSELELTLSRDFGYAGFSNDIQGLFTLKIKDPPENLSKVVFFIDSTSMGEDIQSPFSLQFNTDSFPLGLHSLSAVGYATDGSELNSNIIQVQFVPAGSGMESVIKIVIPVVVLIILIALVAVFLPIILSKGKIASTPLGTPRKYGVGGGAICPKCSRPFPLRLWWINLGASKIDRCPYCGKWSFVRPRSISDLRAAEAAELADTQPEKTINGESEADKLQKDLDESRYQNM